MKNKFITLYLTSIVMFALSGMFIIESNDSKNNNNIQHLDFTHQPVYIYSKVKNKN